MLISHYVNGIIIKNRETYAEITFPCFPCIDSIEQMFYTNNGTEVFLMQAGGMLMLYEELSETEKELIEAVRADSSLIIQFQQSCALLLSSRQTQHDTA